MKEAPAPERLINTIDGLRLAVEADSHVPITEKEIMTTSKALWHVAWLFDIPDDLVNVLLLQILNGQAEARQQGYYDALRDVREHHIVNEY